MTDGLTKPGAKILIVDDEANTLASLVASRHSLKRCRRPARWAAGR